MQSYKLRKTSETSLFPIENELRLMRKENDKSWTSLMLKIMSVLLSGIGTTLMCQEDYIPALVNSILLKFSENPGKIWVIIFQALLAAAVFIGCALVALKLVNWRNITKDNKKSGDDRENLAEIFHKITLNNIITGKSFTKKAQSKMDILQKNIQEYNAKKDKDPQEAEQISKYIKEVKREVCLYISEAIYYFSVADRQIREKKLIERGQRSEYIEYLKEVGVITLMETLLMYENSIEEIQTLSAELQQIENTTWKENPYEVISIVNNLDKVEKIKENIVIWQAKLNDTLRFRNGQEHKSQ